MSTIFHKSALMFATSLFLYAGSVQAQRAIFTDAVNQEGAFQMGNLELPEWDIIPAGPGRDGIPAIDEPIFAQSRHIRDIEDTEPVLGIVVDGIAKAYPIRILALHEIVNDNFGATAVAVTYSPLCGGGVAYKADGRFEDWQFAVSGLLYNNNLLMFDRQTESLWSQLMGRAVSGPAAGQQLDRLPCTMTTWGEWNERYPQSMVLTKETGFSRNYDKNPYDQYAANDRLMFPLNHTDKRLPLKHRVLGVEVNGQFKAYPYSLLASADNAVIEDNFNGQALTIEFVPESQTVFVTDELGNLFPSVSLYWFAWSAFHTNTEVYSPANRPAGISMNLGAAFE